MRLLFLPVFGVCPKAGIFLDIFHTKKDLYLGMAEREYAESNFLIKRTWDR
jgi:hypothetical protein